jgi:hypothetical protein
MNMVIVPVVIVGVCPGMRSALLRVGVYGSRLCLCLRGANSIIV